MKISVLLSIAMMVLALSISYAEDLKYKDPKYYGDTFDWNNLGPVDFLELLKSKKNEKCPIYSVFGMHTTWVKINHIPDLVALLDSKEPCANVCSIYSSFLDCNKSTIGREAAFIIEGFRRSKYPPDLNSGRADLIKSEIKIWWRDYSDKIEKKLWHVSPSRNTRSSTIYPYVDWTVIESLYPGMTAENATKLIHDLQYYHHPINAIVFSEYKGIEYEVALRLSEDKKIIEDISYKKIE